MATPLRFEPSEEFKALIEDVRSKIKDVAVDDYGYGVVDALAYLWAGMPNAREFGATNSQLMHLLQEAGL